MNKATTYLVQLFRIGKRAFNNKLINGLIKLLVIALVSLVIYWEVFARENAAEILSEFNQKLVWSSLPYLLLAVILMPLNWAFETEKWRCLILKIEDISFWKSYKAILTGVSLSLFTPNRLGEIGGRILLVKPENNWKAVIATLVGSFSQLMVLLSIGFLGLLYYIWNFTSLSIYAIEGIAFLGLLCLILLFYCFYNIGLVIPLVKGKVPYANYLSKYKKHVEVLQHYEKRELTKVLTYAFLRYMVYTLQYYLMLCFFGINVPLIAGLAGIATIFLVQTSIPLPPIAGLLVRGEVALQLWGLFGANEISILAATFGLWILNLIVPALIGIIFIININVLKSLGYEKKDA